MMPRSAWIMVVVSLLAGAVGGVAGRSIGGTKPAQTVRPADSEAASGRAGEPPPADLSARVARLERELARRERERRIARALAADGGMPTGRGSSAVDDPVFEAAVRDVLQRVDEERGDDRRQRRTERAQRFADRWGGEVAEKLGLRDDQKQKIAAIMREQLEAMARLRAGDGGTEPDRDQRRAALRAERDKTDGKLAEVLSASQLQELERLRENGELPGPWGRRSAR